MLLLVLCLLFYEDLRIILHINIAFGNILDMITTENENSVLNLYLIYIHYTYIHIYIYMASRICYPNICHFSIRIILTEGN